MNEPVTLGDFRLVSRFDHFSPSQLRVDSALSQGITNGVETSVSSVNTGTPLPSPNGASSVTAAVGDIIVKYERSAGTANFRVFMTYHAES